MNDLAHIIGALECSAPILEAFVVSIPENALTRRRGEGFWTIAEHANHLAAVQPMLADRIQRFLDEDAPEFVPFIPADNEAEAAPPVLNMPAATAAFAAGREAQVALLNTATPSDWKKGGRHPEYTQYTLYILARHILMHDHWHMYRMEELWLARDEYLTILAG
ncbi:MAG: DinB family protein [Pseudomonadota bacterium]